MENIRELLLRMPAFEGEKKQMSRGKLIAVKVILAVILAATLAGAVLSIMGKKITGEMPIYEAMAKGTAQYEVQLAPNTYFTQTKLPMNQTYIRSLVQTIYAKFDCEVAAAGTGEMTVDYGIVGRASATYNDNGVEKEVWSQTAPLVANQTKEIRGSDTAVLSVPVSVDQSAFASVINNFQQQLGINVTGTYDIVFTATMNGKAEGKDKSSVYTSIVSIPLNGKAFNIGLKEGNVPVGLEFSRTISATTGPDKTKCFACTAVALLAACGLLLFCLCYEEARKSSYHSNIKMMTDSIKDRIAYVNYVSECSNDDVEIADFESLIRLADERGLPILCAKNDRKRTALFFLVENGRRFYYVFEQKGDKKPYEDDYDEDGYDEDEELKEAMSELAAENKK